VKQRKFAACAQAPARAVFLYSSGSIVQHPGISLTGCAQAPKGGSTMKRPRRQFLHLAAGTAALPVLLRVATAQAYPSRPVRLIVGFPAGGPTDITARVMAQWLSERLGQQVVVDNRAGAGSNIAAEGVVNAPPDGYTLLLVGATNAINATLYEKLNFNFIRDIAPVCGIIRVPLIMEVHPSVPVKTVAEFIAYAKAIPARSTWGRAGLGPRSTSPASCSR
jgi:tripartite-type tricarboxylate transporter receptor subunit TctC